MFFKSKKSNYGTSQRQQLMRSMQDQADKMGAGYEEALNYLAKGFNHFRYESGSIDPKTSCTYLDYNADYSLDYQQAGALEQRMRVMVKDAQVYLALLSPTSIRLEIRL